MVDLNQFKVYLLNNGRRKQTIYKHLLWARKISEQYPDWSIEGIERFLASKKEEGGKNTAINAIITTIRCYAHHRGRQDILDYFKYLKEEHYERSTLSNEEIEAILKLKNPNYKNAYKRRWKMYTIMLSILAFTGLRPSEACKLTVDDCDFGLGVFHIRESKTPAGVGQVPMPPNIVPMLQDYITNLKGEKLFSAPRGGIDNDGYWDPGTVSTHFNKRLKLLGIRRPRLSLYSLRHSFGTTLADPDSGVNLAVVQKLLRHSNIQTTLRYVHPNINSMKKGQAKHPLVMRTAKPTIRLKYWSDNINSWEIENDERFVYKFQVTEKSIDLHVHIRKKFFH